MMEQNQLESAADRAIHDFFFLTKKEYYGNHCVLSVMTLGGIQFIMRCV